MNISTGSLTTRQAKILGESESEFNLLEDKKIKHMMDNMGYIPGQGLGINSNGISSPLDPILQIGKTGLGYNLTPPTNKRNFDDIEDNRSIKKK